MIAVTLGTRPEIIKLAPVIRELERLEYTYSIVHTNQHYDANMDAIFFRDLEILYPHYTLRIGSGSHGDQTGKMLSTLEVTYKNIHANAVLALGDTNTTLAAGLTSSKMHIDFIHAEAGFRSFNRKMPEEINRIVADHVADILCAPCSLAEENLLWEGIPQHKIVNTGNTIVDSVQQNLPIARSKSRILEELDVHEYILVTCHRAENTDNRKRLQAFLESLSKIANRESIDIVFPIHPRTRKMISVFGLENLICNRPWLYVIEPTGYFDFLVLEENASCVITDSGGVQDECYALDVPTIIIRDSTEKTDILCERFRLSEVQANVLYENVVEAMNTAPLNNEMSPYGTGNAGRNICKILEAYETSNN